MGREATFRREHKRTKCRRCMFKKAAQSHHVVYAQEVVRRGADVWDLRNCMPLCQRCHEQHHTRTSPVPLLMLSDANIAFAFEILGEYAKAYLEARYAGSDERLDLAMEEAA